MVQRSNMFMKKDWREQLEELRIKSLKDMFGIEKPIIGMVHLMPMPGSIGYRNYTMNDIIDFALEDANALVEGGVDALMVENMWDIPYYVGTDVPPEAMCCQAVAAREVVKAFNLPVGINVVHNGGIVTLGIAMAAGAAFIRVCLLAGAQVWDTGEFDHGCAAELLRKRQAIGAENIKIFADVDKKHSVRFPGIDLATHIEWTEFYQPDALIVSGKMTGSAPELSKVKKASKLASRPILMGSGTNPENVADFLQYADGAIVGSSLKKDGRSENPVDVKIVKKYMDAVNRVRESL